MYPDRFYCDTGREKQTTVGIFGVITLLLLFVVSVQSYCCRITTKIQSKAHTLSTTQ